MKNYKIFLCQLLFAVIAFASCSKEKDIVPNDPRYTTAEAFKHMASDPDKMLNILDSAVIVGNIKWEKAELYKANCYSMTSKVDTALTIVNRLLDKKLYGNDEELYADLLIAKVQIASNMNDIPMIIKSAEEASKTCKEMGDKYGDKYNYYATDMANILGYYMVKMGDEEEGFNILDETTNEIKDCDSYYSLQVLVNCHRRKINALFEIDDFEMIPKLCDEILFRIDEFIASTKDTDNLKPILEDFADHSRASFLSKKANAFIKLGDKSKAKETLDKYLETNWSKNPLSNYQIIETYLDLDMYKEFNQAIDILNIDLEGKPLTSSNIFVEKAKADMARKQGDLEKSIDLYKDVIEKTKKLNKQDYKVVLARTLAVYEVNEANQKAYNSEMKVLKLRIWIILISVILFVFTSWTIEKVLKKRRNKEITETIIEKHKVDETTDNQLEASSNSQDDEKSTQQMATLYAKIVDVMGNKKPYTDPEFDIIHLAALIGTNKSYISRTINKIEGKNFRTWLSEYRNNIVINCICANSDISINDLCEIAGYANRETLSRHFKSINGITLSEFKDQLKKS